MSWLINFIRFSRPHTIIGTSLSVVALYAIALSYSEEIIFQTDLLILTLVSCLGANIYIVGLNQIIDIEIDKINKPYLPLASGAYSLAVAQTIIVVSVLISITIAWWLGSYLWWTVIISLVIGSAYSLPPIRLKRFHFWAAFSIIAVRGLVVNLLLFLHFHYELNSLEEIPMIVWLLTATIFIYSVIIAWYKDIPDMEGDRAFRIHTLSLSLGARNVLLIGNVMLTAVYLLLIFLALTNIHFGNIYLVSGMHLIFVVAIWLGYQKVDFERSATISNYYQFIWGLFFLEYITFAISRWL